jgi:hypothetical protein
MLLAEKVNEFNTYYTWHKGISSLYLSIKKSLDSATTIGVGESINKVDLLRDSNKRDNIELDPIVKTVISKAEGEL